MSIANATQSVAHDAADHTEHEVTDHAANRDVLGTLCNVAAEKTRGWQDRALCAQTDPEAFFPEKGGSTRPPKQVCNNCEVRADCLKYALEHDLRYGVWGGLSERERRRLTRPASPSPAAAGHHPTPGAASDA